MLYAVFQGSWLQSNKSSKSHQFAVNCEQKDAQISSHLVSSESGTAQLISSKLVLGCNKVHSLKYFTSTFFSILYNFIDLIVKYHIFLLLYICLTA